jgi:hypothetical protein
MIIQEIIDGLTALGFTSGYAIGGEPPKIILWENDLPEPTVDQILSASQIGSYQREYDSVTAARQADYARLSDPIFMQYQRGEATKQEWVDAVAAVKDANPYPAKK